MAFAFGRYGVSRAASPADGFQLGSDAPITAVMSRPSSGGTGASSDTRIVFTVEQPAPIGHQGRNTQTGLPSAPATCAPTIDGG